MTYNHYIYNNSTQTWDSWSTFGLAGPSDASSGAKDLIYLTSISTPANYRPEKYYKFKTTWVSTYSEKTEDEGSTINMEFWIRVYDACMDA